MKCATDRLQTPDSRGIRPQTSALSRKRQLGLVPRSAKREGGFTLYEVIIVLIVILVASAVVIPSFTGFLPAVRVRKAGDELIATFSKARADAVLTSRRFRVVFTQQPPAFRLEYEPDPMNEPATFRALSGDWGAKSELPEGVSFSTLEGTEPVDETSEECLEFSPDGSAPAATIVLSHENGETLTIEIDAANGKARVVEPGEEKP